MQSFFFAQSPLLLSLGNLLDSTLLSRWRCGAMQPPLDRLYLVNRTPKIEFKLTLFGLGWTQPNAHRRRLVQRNKCCAREAVPREPESERHVAGGAGRRARIVLPPGIVGEIRWNHVPGTANVRSRERGCCRVQLWARDGAFPPPFACFSFSCFAQANLV